jgi:hypothetical protein
MSSKYLSSLSSDQYKDLTAKLLKIQNHRCFICQKPIDPIHKTDIDHINPNARHGPDTEENFAVTHESCNRTKLDSNLNTARILYRLRDIQEITLKEEGKQATLKNVLKIFGGSKFNFRCRTDNGNLCYSFSDLGNNTIEKSPIFIDGLSQEKTAYIEIPIEYLFHDELINPRGINESILKLIKEFEKGNPQLHSGIARIDDNKIKLFDGQHKAVAQILLGQKKILLRLFLEPDIDRLIETNTNAGSTLRQIAFDKSIMRQLNYTLYYERIKKYQEDHKLMPDDLSFSEQNLIDYFRGEGINIKKYIHDSVKHSITHSKENKLKDFIDFEGRAKELPISYSAYDKVILSAFINSKTIHKTPLNHLTDEGLNPRELEIKQVTQLLNIIAEEIYIGRFSPEIGVVRIENKIVSGKDIDIPDNHLTAYRISKEEVMAGWIPYLHHVIMNYFSNTGKIYDSTVLLQNKFDPQLWTNIRNFMIHLRELPLWKDRSMAGTIFSGKNPYYYWEQIFKEGTSVDGAQVLANPLNVNEMIRPYLNHE